MKIFTVQVKAHPRRKSGVMKVEDDGTLVISVAAARAEGKANQELVRFLADYFAVSPSLIKILKGHLSTRKVVQID